VDRTAANVQTRYIIATHVAGLDATTRVVVGALAQAFWEPSFSDRAAFFGLGAILKKLVALVKKAPMVVRALLQTLGLHQTDELDTAVKSGDLVKRVVSFAMAGKKALSDVFKAIASQFPLSMFFVPAKRAPSITALLARILQASPKIRALLSKVKGGVDKIDSLLKKHVPRLSRVVYAAVFVWVWLHVAELSWDIDGILAGFTGRISLGELLASLPESALGLVAASFGLGYGALPYAIIARLVWLVANEYLEWSGGRFRVRWSEMGVLKPDEVV
jgi:hypothetical protein